MGDGYEQILADGINNILLPFDVSFEDRGIDEYAAILHFFQNRAGVEKFYFVPPAPFNVLKRFICQEWNATQSFYDKYTITAKFDEKS
jgi:phage-related protein